MPRRLTWFARATCCRAFSAHSPHHILLHSYVGSGSLFAASTHTPLYPPQTPLPHACVTLRVFARATVCACTLIYAASAFRSFAILTACIFAHHSPHSTDPILSLYRVYRHYSRSTFIRPLPDSEQLFIAHSAVTHLFAFPGCQRSGRWIPAALVPFRYGSHYRSGGRRARVPHRAARRTVRHAAAHAAPLGSHRCCARFSTSCLSLRFVCRSPGFYGFLCQDAASCYRATPATFSHLRYLVLPRLHAAPFTPTYRLVAFLRCLRLVLTTFLGLPPSCPRPFALTFRHHHSVAPRCALDSWVLAACLTLRKGARCVGSILICDNFTHSPTQLHFAALFNTLHCTFSTPVVPAVKKTLPITQLPPLTCLHSHLAIPGALHHCTFVCVLQFPFPFAYPGHLQVHWFIFYT